MSDIFTLTKLYKKNYIVSVYYIRLNILTEEQFFKKIIILLQEESSLPEDSNRSHRSLITFSQKFSELCKSTYIFFHFKVCY